RDFRHDKETSFRSFAELCVTRQIITAIKTATRYKHQALNNYVSFSNTPAGQDADSDCTLGDALPGSHVDEPSVQVISTEELKSRVFCLGTGLSRLEADALRKYLEGSSYEDMADELGCDTKTIDNALQRVKRKIVVHRQSRPASGDGDGPADAGLPADALEAERRVSPTRRPQDRHGAHPGDERLRMGHLRGRGLGLRRRLCVHAHSGVALLVHVGRVHEGA